MSTELSASPPQLSQNDNEVIKNRVFGMPLTRMTRHQRVSFTAMIKIAYDKLMVDKNTFTFTYKTDDFFKMIGISEKRKESHLFSRVDDWGVHSEEYSLEETLRKLLNKTILMRHKDKDGKIYTVEETVLVSYFKITKEEITFEFSNWVRDRIPAVNNVYIMKLHTIASFVSGYSVTLFEQLEQRRDFKKWEVPIVDLRNIFGLEEHKYEKFSDFRKSVVEKAIAEINEKSNYTLTYTLIKKGRSVNRIIFTWHLEKDADPYSQWKSFIRSTFVDIPLIKGKLGNSSIAHVIKVNSNGLLYNGDNPEYVYSLEESKRIWKYMFDHQDAMLIKNITKESDTTVDPDTVKDFSLFIGKDYYFDGELYLNIISITPVKDKVKVIFYNGSTFILTEKELAEGVKF